MSGTLVSLSSCVFAFSCAEKPSSSVDPIGADYVKGLAFWLVNLVSYLDACSFTEVCRAIKSVPMIADFAFSCAIFLMCDAIVYVLLPDGEA